MTGSWHIPYIHSYPSASPKDTLHVVFLSRCPEQKRTQILEKLERVDTAALANLGVHAIVKPRKIQARQWIRDYDGDSTVIYEIARGAFVDDKDVHRTLVFINPADNDHVTATCWISEPGMSDARLEAVHIPHGSANVLLADCEEKAKGLSEVLGEEEFKRVKLDLTGPLSPITPDAEGFQWPSCLPESLVLSGAAPIVISLRNLGQATFSELAEKLRDSGKTSNELVRIHNWEGAQLDRFQMRKLVKQIHARTPEEHRHLPIYFVDNILSTDDELVVLCATRIAKESDVDAFGVHLTVIDIGSFFSGWMSFVDDPSRTDLDEQHSDIWRKETVYGLRNLPDFDDLNFCAVLFLAPFSITQQRGIRNEMSKLSDVEEGMDWGKNFLFLGFPWTDSEVKTLDDVRVLFESCDPFSPSLNAQKPGPLGLKSYPHHFIAIDDAIFESDKPKVWLCSSLDFSGDNVNDQLGWFYGRISAREAMIDYSNLSIANMGPEELFDDEEGKKLWLSDLKGYRENDWNSDMEDDDGEEGKKDDVRGEGDESTSEDDDEGV